MFRKIVLCADGSEHALEAARAVAELTQKFDSHITLLSVYNPAITPIPFVNLPESIMMAEGDVTRYSQELHAAVEERTGAVLNAANLRYACRREIGHPVDRILAVAHDVGADLIVLGSRGLTEWKSLLLGSVSDGVLHHAHCPVLIVR